MTEQLAVIQGVCFLVMLSVIWLRIEVLHGKWDHHDRMLDKLLQREFDLQQQTEDKRRKNRTMFD
jgi:hypothetical protein